MEHIRHGFEGGNNGDPLLRVALMMAASLFIASFMPPPLVALTLSELLRLAALVTAGWALVTRQPIWGSPVFTRWDEAAALMAASLVAGMAVDPAAIGGVLSQLEGLADATGDAVGGSGFGP